MKTTYQLLSVMSLVALSACSQGKLTNEVSKTSSQTSGGTTTTTTPVIDLGNLGAGTTLNLEANPTPTPGPGTGGSTVVEDEMGAIQFKAVSTLVKLLDVISSDAHAASGIAGPAAGGTLTPITLPIATYQFFDYAAIDAKLVAQFGSTQLATFRSLYANYLLNTAAGVPAQLQQVVKFSFGTGAAPLVLPLVEFLDLNVGIYAYGANAYIGKAMVPAVYNTTTGVLVSPAVAFSAISGLTYTNVGSGLRALGGTLTASGLLNRQIVNIAFNNYTHKYIVSVIGSYAFAASTAYKKVVIKPVSGLSALPAGYTTADLGTKALIAYIRVSDNKIGAIGSLDLVSGVAGSSALGCSAVISYFPGYSCYSSITSGGTLGGTVGLGSGSGSAVSGSLSP